MPDNSQNVLERIKTRPPVDIMKLPWYKRLWAAFKKVMTVFPKWFGLYLGLIGLFSFNCFILEEAFQTVMFGSWGAFDAKEYRLIKREVATMEGLRSTLKTVNNLGGWLNPFGWFSYNGYVKAEREYIDALNAKLFANAPEQFAGEIVTFTFMPQEEEPNGDYSAYRNGRITVMAKKLTPIVTGRVTVDKNQIIVDAR